MRILLMLLTIVVLLISGCSSVINSSDKVVCNDPYIRYGEECCLDSNNNSICDNDEENNKSEDLNEENSNSETTGSQTQERIATGFTVIQVGATDTSDGVINKGDEFEIRVQLAPGSDAIKINNVTLALITTSGSNSYTFNATTSSDTTFTAEAIRGELSNNYINSDDVVNFKFLSSANIIESEDFEVTLFPGAGTAQRISLVTPPSMTTVYTVLK